MDTDHLYNLFKDKVITKEQYGELLPYIDDNNPREVQNKIENYYITLLNTALTYIDYYHNDITDIPTILLNDEVIMKHHYEGIRENILMNKDRTRLGLKKYFDAIVIRCENYIKLPSKYRSDIITQLTSGNTKNFVIIPKSLIERMKTQLSENVEEFIVTTESQIKITLNLEGITQKLKLQLSSEVPEFTVPDDSKKSKISPELINLMEEYLRTNNI